MNDDITVTVQRWPVLLRRTDESGKVSRSKSSYVRTAAPLEEREVVLGDFVTRTRVRLYFGSGDHQRTFSLNTGRGIGLADWVIRADSLKVLRNVAKELFPDEARALERALRALSGCAAPQEDDDESEDGQPLEPAAANDVSS